jgi:hypothetical protein
MQTRTRKITIYITGHAQAETEIILGFTERQYELIVGNTTERVRRIQRTHIHGRDHPPG